MGMNSRFKEYLATEDELCVPVSRRELQPGLFSDLFSRVFYDTDIGSSPLGRLYVAHHAELNAALIPFEENGMYDEARYDSKTRAEMISAAVEQVARRAGTSPFRLMTGATLEQEAAFNFFDEDLNGEFTDYTWAVRWANVQPEDIFAVDQMGKPRLRGILRASQGRVNTEDIRIQHVAHVLSISPKMSREHVETPGWSLHIEELTAGYARGFLDDSLLRLLAHSGFESTQFKVAVELLCEGMAPEYAFECARGAV
jgi:hypothetical protein